MSEAPTAQSRRGWLAQDEVELWAWWSAGLTAALVAAHVWIALRSGSLSVAAEAVHNASDLAVATVLLVGVRLARRKSARYPYGLYKLENLLAAAMAIAVFVTAYEIAMRALDNPTTDVRVAPWMLATIVVTTLLPVVFAHFEMRAGRRLNSPALVADAREYRTHVATTGLVLSGLVSQTFRVDLDRVAAMFIVIAIIRTGWQLLIDSMRVLLDASLDHAHLARARAAIEQDPGVVALEWMSGRSAGRYRFLEAGVVLRPHALARSDIVVGRIESAVKLAVPHLERVLLHVEPARTVPTRVAVPLAATSGRVSEHFGAAPLFGLVDVERSPPHRPRERRIVENPFLERELRRGLKVAHWLIEMKVDVVYSRESLDDKGPAIVFGDAGVELRTTTIESFDAIIDEFSRALATSASVGGP